MRRGIGIALLAAVLLSPICAAALTRDEIQQEIATLMAQLIAVQAQLQALTIPRAAPHSAPPVSCPTLSRSLQRGVFGDDVSALQQFLAARGLLSPEYSLGSFDAQTEAAVQDWQTQTGIVSSGDARTSGFGAVGPRTRASIASTCTGAGASLGVSVGGSSPFIAILHVRVNTGGACTPRTYVLDYGDGTVPQQIATGNSCAVIAQSFPHTYPGEGVYTATVSSGPLRVSNTVTISSSNCIAPIFAIPSSTATTLGNLFTIGLISYADDPSNPTLVEATGTPPGLSLIDQPLYATSSKMAVHAWVLTGTSTLAGSFDVTVFAKNACGSARATLTIPVSAGSY